MDELRGKVYDCYPDATDPICLQARTFYAQLLDHLQRELDALVAANTDNPHDMGRDTTQQYIARLGQLVNLINVH